MNTVEFQITGKYAMFSDPLFRIGGEKSSTRIPSYGALKGILQAVFWKPTITWFIDEVRIMNQIQTEYRGVRLPDYNGDGNDLAYYTYLRNCCYQVRAHFEWNQNRPEFAHDRNENKYHEMALRMIKKGGRRDIFLGTRECQGYVEPCVFGDGDGFYDNSGNVDMGFSYHSITYADEAFSDETKGQMTANFWRPVMQNGVIRFLWPEECPVHKTLGPMRMKIFAQPLTTNNLPDYRHHSSEPQHIQLLSPRTAPPYFDGAIDGSSRTILQRACETYDNNIEKVAQSLEGHEPLAPVFHSLRTSGIEIVLDGEGHFLRASVVPKTEPRILIPVTDVSDSRTGNIAPHPLCDQICYVAPYFKAKNQAYLTQLLNWMNSKHTHPKLQPIFNYVANKTILTDLENAQVMPRHKNGHPEKESEIIRWRIECDDTEKNGACWEDKSLFASYCRFYSEQLKNRKPVLDMITGDTAAPAMFHPKGILTMAVKAKLISAGDTKGFTYRGRTEEAWQSATVGHLSSQKAHNALRWIVRESGTTVGNQTYLCWSVFGNHIPNPLFWLPDLPVCQDEETFLAAVRTAANCVIRPNDIVITASLAASTIGRLAVTSYSESDCTNLLQGQIDWFTTYSCHTGWYGIRSPSIYQIANYTYGIEHKSANGVNIKAPDAMMSKTLERLMMCRTNNIPIPADIIQAITQKASNPMAYSDVNWSYVLYTACALIRGYYNKTYKKTIPLELDEFITDPAYLYGRLLAFLEHTERLTFHSDSARVPAAIRYMASFRAHPYRTGQIIYQHIKLRSLSSYSIIEKRKYLKPLNVMWDQVQRYVLGNEHNLDALYLVGYLHQRNDILHNHKHFRRNDR